MFSTSPNDCNSRLQLSSHFEFWYFYFMLFIFLNFTKIFKGRISTNYKLPYSWFNWRNQQVMIFSIQQKRCMTHMCVYARACTRVCVFVGRLLYLYLGHVTWIISFEIFCESISSNNYNKGLEMYLNRYIAPYIWSFILFKLQINIVYFQTEGHKTKSFLSMRVN